RAHARRPRSRGHRTGARRARSRGARPRQPPAAPHRGGGGRRHARRDLRPLARSFRHSQALGGVLSRRVWAIGGLLRLGPLASAGSAAAGMADRVGATFALMIDDFTKAFSPLEGLVIGEDGSTLYLDIGESGGAQAGQEFTIFRKGEELHHPITRKVLGRYEEVLGYAQIRTVQPRFSGPLHVHVQEVLALPDRAVRVSRKFEVAGWVVPVLIERRGVVYLDATWISAVTGTALFSRRAPLLPPAAAEEQRFPWEPASED